MRRWVSIVVVAGVFLTGCSSRQGGLVAHWKFDEMRGEIAKDSSGNGNVGRLVGNPVWAKGKTGGALSFDGDGDYVAVGNESNFDITEQITVAAWIKVNKFDRAWQTIVGKGDNTWRLARYKEENGLKLNCDDESGYVGVAGDMTVNDGGWHHVAGVYDGKKMYLYVDGKLDASVEHTGKIRTDDYDVYIGENTEVLGHEWDGLIDDVRIYDRALSADEIVQLYNRK